jgi:mycothiol synthase
MTGRQITSAELTTAQIDEVLALVGAARLADGVAPLSEHAMLHLRYDSTGQSGAARSGGRDFIVTANGEIAGYAYLDPASAEGEVTGELVIHPRRRRQGLGRALTGELVAAAAGYMLRLWAHGDLPAAAALARTTGFERFRALWQLHRSLGEPLDQPVLPAGRELRTFVPGQDEDEWLSLNGRAFAKHPEQGGWTRHDLELREREPWFDPAGFFIATRDGRMTGFHWTKVHDSGTGGSRGDGSPREENQQSLGEVYVVGVDPVEQGSGLGRALTLTGLRYLRDLGVGQVMLYVDEDNVPAVKMYEALGFTRAKVDAMYRRPTVLARGDNPPEPPAPGRPLG